MPLRAPYLDSLQAFVDAHTDWHFGHLGYGLKAETEGIHGGPADPVGFAPAFFFVPQWVIRCSGGEVQIGSWDDDHSLVWDAVNAAQSIASVHVAPVMRPLMSREDYVGRVRQLQQHILRGDCYEINFCQAFAADAAIIDPLRIFNQLASVSPNPFAAYYRVGEQFLICASPERFLQKLGNRLITQPIKGTIGRNLYNAEADLALQQALRESPKERAENVMVVDLVRNDLSRVCREGTVKVSELFGIYPFPQVHQMISTIEGELRAGTELRSIIRACFPMGSMTGAPKKRVLELIDQYETVGRGLFSGSVGYITPEQDLDLNVVIRSVLYNRQEAYLSYLAGSGITFYADPESEYEECMLKAEAMQQALR